MNPEKKYGMVVEQDQDGRVTNSWQSPHGTFEDFSEGYLHTDGYITREPLQHLHSQGQIWFLTHLSISGFIDLYRKSMQISHETKLKVIQAIFLYISRKENENNDTKNYYVNHFLNFY